MQGSLIFDVANGIHNIKIANKMQGSLIFDVANGIHNIIERYPIKCKEVLLFHDQ
jgi:hypothetical protein